MPTSPLPLPLIHPRPVLPVLLLVLCATLAACTAPQAGGPDVPAMAPYAASDRLASNRPFGHQMDITLARRTLRFLFIEGPDKGQAIDMTYTPTAEPSGRACLRQFGRRELAHLRLDDDGRLVMTAIENHKHRVVTRFNPPLPIVVPNAPYAQPLTFTSQATIYKAGQPDKPWGQGPCTLVMEYDGRQPLDLPAGRFDCHRLKVLYEGRFNIASVKSQTLAWYAPGVGLVAQHYHESGRMLFVPWTHRYTMVLQDVLAPADRSDRQAD